MNDPRATRCLAWIGNRRLTGKTLSALVAAASAAGLGPASINRHLAALRAHLRAVEPGGRWERLEWPWQREPRGRTRTISPADQTRLLAALPPDVRRFATFLVETGMRVSEALGLREGDVGAREAYVRKSKNGESREVPLTAAALAAYAATPFSLSQSRLNHEFRKAVAALGLGDLRPHDLRHTCASRLVDAGVPTPVVAAWLGHRDQRSTLRYVHVSTSGLQKAREMLEGV